MPKMLTKDEWRAIKPPFSFIKITNKAWLAVHREMIVSWIEEHCGAGFTYWDGHETYVFGSEGDKLMFKMWIKDDPFANEEGEIKAR